MSTILSGIKQHVLIVLIATNLLTFFFCWYTGSDRQYEQAKKRFPFLSKRIVKEHENNILINFTSLRKKLRDYAKDKEESVSFYFEYLPTGVSIGINEKRDYNVASLFKVPVVMALLHVQEQKRWDIATTEVVVKPEHIDKKFGNLWKKGAGTRLTVDEGIKLALIESDNTAVRALIDHVEISDLMNIYDGLDIPFQHRDEQVVMTTKSYSSVLKALYFSSILSQAHSNYILQLMTQTAFRDKIPHPLPTDIPVAHKIGVYEDSLYHDCGIVYVPLRPYLLCVIVDEEEPKAREYMQEISNIIYAYVSTTAGIE